MPFYALAVLALYFAAPSPSPAVRIEIPREGSQPSSAYLGVLGTGPAGAAIELFDGRDTTPLRTLRAEPDGHFECLLRLAPGAHSLTARVLGSDARPASVHVRIPSGFAGPAPGASYELMQVADILLSHTPGSEQEELDGARYTHAALYLGPDPSGTPLVAEAITWERTASSNPLGAIGLEETLIWRGGASVDIYRLNHPISFPQRSRIAAWAYQRVNQEAAFWSVTQDFGGLFRAWLLWDQRRDQPRDAAESERTLKQMEALKMSPDRLNCTTLVWQAYWRATEHRIDLSHPNRVTFGGLGARMSPRFLDQLRPFLVLPDTLALTGKLRKVNGA